VGLLPPAGRSILCHLLALRKATWQKEEHEWQATSKTKKGRSPPTSRCPLVAAPRTPGQTIRLGSVVVSNDCLERQGGAAAPGRSATIESERERFDRRRSQFDPLLPVV
jgi:hypothetical protein